MGIIAARVACASIVVLVTAAPVQAQCKNGQGKITYVSQGDVKHDPPVAPIAVAAGCTVTWTIANQLNSERKFKVDNFYWIKKVGGKDVRIRKVDCVSPKDVKVTRNGTLTIQIGDADECYDEAPLSSGGIMKFDVKVKKGWGDEASLDPKLEIERPGTLKD